MLTIIGYYCVPKDDEEFVYMLLDANYYHLPRLMHQLATSEIFMRIGNFSFRIPRNIFSNPGDTPNFFTLGFTAFFGSEIEENRSKAFIRPPPLASPNVPNRSGELFSDLLKVLQGGPISFRNAEHRQLLLRECRYYRLRNLEQKLIEHSIQANRGRNQEEIVINLEDIKFDHLTMKNLSCGSLTTFYKRPFVDTTFRELVIQMKSDEQVALFKQPPNSWEVIFFDGAREKVNKIFVKLLADFGLKPKTGTKGFVVDATDATISLNEGYIDPRAVSKTNPRPELDIDDIAQDPSNPKKRRRVAGPDAALQMVSKRSLWRIKKCEQEEDGDEKQENYVEFELLKAECICGQRFKNRVREFL